MRPGRGDRSLHRPDLDRGFEWGEQFFRNLQGWLDPLQVPGQGQRPGFLNGQPGTGFRLKLDGVGPIQQGCHLAAHEQETTIFLDQMRSPVLVTCRDGLLDGFGDKSVLLVPLGSAAMQLGEQMRETGVPGAS